MRKYVYQVALMILGLTSCQKQLDVNPKATLNEDQVSTPEQVEGFVIAAYSQLGNDEINRAFSMYQYGDVRADDAYKGGGGISDGDVFHFMETFTNSRPDQWNYDGIWFNIYVGIRRANEGLRVLNKFTTVDFPLLNTRKAELRLLRGYWYLMVENLFKNIPYIDEDLPADRYKLEPNDRYTRDQILDKIAADFEFAAQNLPASQPQIGRANKYAAYAFLAKTRLFQAYKQDDKHGVTSIDQQRLQQVLDASNAVLASGYKLQPDFANNFTTGSFENGQEAILSVQFSTNDGAGRGRVNYGDMLTVPQGIGCCDFKKPSQNLVNAFRTSATGVPLLDTYSSQNVDFSNNTVDPRLDHTVSRPGVPWKYDPTRVVTEAWSRNIPIYGTYNSIKENVSPEEFINVAPFFGNTKARILIRLADVMLFKAEALIELGRHQEALPIINEIRARAAKSTAKLVLANGQPTSRYNVQPYIQGTNIDWTQDNARKALRFERRLEMALEGERFFDLVRWGIAEQVMNGFFAVERPARSIFQTARFTKGRDEYLPIPQNQIFWSEGLYVQNPGY
ncbi:RagB/SusD family nutrient uptake outer membrane protein [Mucilaginibacter daejeonensis]|uniref:RagB/SusD family nutrient uptake outer membrane protein n=1 Tax=Mucilaginibacter daejeonensis TaxID=398049 RepID=UPI001D174012|nr:RagB/SusD family nutrient uptake outer membrane protein [Mucilaginibacter daejeonensis]UEG51342.1 RagB/SusD family nutrient uptake outer membrane protein [Mucilaginibacter daejeonensis]